MLSSVRTPRTPSLRHHKPSQQGVVTLNGHDCYLGHWPRDRKKPPENVQAEYDRRIAEWLANGRRSPASTTDNGDGLSVAELVLTFFAHVEKHHRHPDGTPTSEVDQYRLSLKPLRILYGHTRAADFGPLALKAVRQTLIDGSWMSAKEKAARQERNCKIECSRGVVNQRIGRIKRMFRWAASEQLVPPSVYHGLDTVYGLQRGRTEARETEPVKPVPVALVDAILPHISAQAGAILQLMQHTGMRPGEACIIRGIDLDTTGAVWLYRPGSDQGMHGRHKTAWHGIDRVIAIGPQGQAILKPWLRLNLHEYLFQPREAVITKSEQRRAERKSPLTPSQQARKRKARPKRSPGNRYTANSLAHAVKHACQIASVPPWAPNQLRHTFATEVRKQYGIEAAQVLLGHARADVTQVYAEKNLGLAARVAAEIG